jgi:hypothetical protein
MQFTTPIPIQPGNPAINYNSRVVSLGSCFAVNIGQKFDYFKFRNITNPFGIIFHPLAIKKIIGFAVNGNTFTEADIFFHNERWHSFDAHSDLSEPESGVLLANLNSAATTLGNELKQASHVIITLGTAWVYRFTESNALVANCHKVPQKEFTKELLPVDTIAQSLKSIGTLINSVNPEAKIIFTVSPVRHIKDGFTENQWSKANLIAALHQTLNTEHYTLNTGYFPSYEIMMDELRDYRFYAEDMIHPNQLAIDYIWQQFTSSWISEEAQHTMKLASNIQKSLLHRPFNPDSDSYKKFTANLGTKIAMLQQQHPHIQF